MPSCQVRLTLLISIFETPQPAQLNSDLFVVTYNRSKCCPKVVNKCWLVAGKRCIPMQERFEHPSVIVVQDIWEHVKRFLPENSCNKCSYNMYTVLEGLREKHKISSIYPNTSIENRKNLTKLWQNIIDTRSDLREYQSYFARQVFEDCYNGE